MFYRGKLKKESIWTDLIRFNAESHDSMHGYFIRLLKAWQIAALINQFYCVIFIPKDDDEENMSRYIYFTWKNEANLFYYEKKLLLDKK